MKKRLTLLLTLTLAFIFCISNNLIAADIELAEKSTLESILKSGEL
ncbi:MAG: amino acid ABC transporter substrate-binding protein, partial [Desulfamplus sp.]|nr:amino acid ABC transporter substrate-binding protein [Desulfamplus sp.]